MAQNITKEKNEHKGLIHIVDELMLEEHISLCAECQKKLNPVLDKYKD